MRNEIKFKGKLTIEKMNDKFIELWKKLEGVDDFLAKNYLIKLTGKQKNQIPLLNQSYFTERDNKIYFVCDLGFYIEIG